MNVHERESDSFTLFTLLTAWIHLARVAEGHVRFMRVHSWQDSAMDSYVQGPALELTTKPTHQVLSDTVARFPDREALVVRHQNIRLTWRQLAEQVESTARGLIGLGLPPGDRVGVWATNCAEWIYLPLGCARAGLVQVNVNPAYRAHELAYVLRKSGMKALVLRAQDARSNYRQVLEEAMKGQELALRHIVYLGEESWGRMLARGTDVGPGPTD